MVVIIDINPDRVADAVDDITSAGGKAFGLVGDVTNAFEVERLMSDTVGLPGGLDALITVVGGFSLHAAWTPLAELTDEQWNVMMDVNLTYVMRFARATVRIFLQQETPGTIVGIGSISGNVASP